jgi:hypothetical protein
VNPWVAEWSGVVAVRERANDLDEDDDDDDDDDDDEEEDDE